MTVPLTGTEARDLRELERRGEYEQLIAAVRELVAADRRALADPYMKEWCGRRYRDLFLRHAARDRAAVRNAGRSFARLRGRDSRSPRQKVAERFLRRDVEDWKLELPAPRAEAPNATLLFCPGLINGMLPVQAFEDAFPALEAERGMRVLRADTHPVRGCEANVADIAASFEEGAGLRSDCSLLPPSDRVPPEDIWLLGYSKGAADWLTFLSARPDLAGRVRAAVSWAGAVGGSFLADSAYARIRELSLPIGSVGGPAQAVLRALAPMLQMDEGLRRLEEFDVKGAIRDLTTEVRGRFLERHADALDALDVPFFNVTAATSATEVPYFQIQGYLDIARSDRDNDMQVTQEQARMRVPMATDLAVFHAHHWDLSYTPFPRSRRMGSPNLDHPFPRTAAIGGLYELLAELGLLD